MDADRPLHWARPVWAGDAAGPVRFQMCQPWELIPGGWGGQGFLVPGRCCVSLSSADWRKIPLKPIPNSLCCALMACPCGAGDSDAISHGTGGSGQPP